MYRAAPRRSIGRESIRNSTVTAYPALRICSAMMRAMGGTAETGAGFAIPFAIHRRLPLRHSVCEVFDVGGAFLLKRRNGIVASITTTATPAIRRSAGLAGRGSGKPARAPTNNQNIKAASVRSRG